MSPQSEAEFNALLDEYQEGEREAAEEARERGNVKALRPDAVIRPCTYGNLRIGDFITAEPELGAAARFVEVVRLRQGIESSIITLTFETPEPLGVALEDHWVIERAEMGHAHVDASRR